MITTCAFQQHIKLVELIQSDMSSFYSLAFADARNATKKGRGMVVSIFAAS